MFKRGIETANHFRSRFEQCLRLGIIDLSDVIAQMIMSILNSFLTFAVCARGSFDAIVSTQMLRLRKHEQTHKSSGLLLAPIGI